jgi:ribosomal protein S27AE
MQGSTCPKCAIGIMGPPRFVRVDHAYLGVVERLRHRCPACGYEADTPCADAQSAVTIWPGPRARSAIDGAP